MKRHMHSCARQISTCCLHLASFAALLPAVLLTLLCSRASSLAVSATCFITILNDHHISTCCGAVCRMLWPPALNAPLPPLYVRRQLLQLLLQLFMLLLELQLLRLLSCLLCLLQLQCQVFLLLQRLNEALSCCLRLGDTSWCPRLQAAHTATQEMSRRLQHLCYSVQEGQLLRSLLFPLNYWYRTWDLCQLQSDTAAHLLAASWCCKLSRCSAGATVALEIPLLSNNSPFSATTVTLYLQDCFVVVGAVASPVGS